MSNNIVYMWEVGGWTGIFMFLLSRKYFKKFSDKGGSDDVPYTILKSITAFLIVISLYWEQYACLALAFFSAFILSFIDFQLQFGTYYKKIKFIEKRRNFCSSLIDNRILNEHLLFTVNSDYISYFENLMRLLCKLIAISFSIAMGLDYKNIIKYSSDSVINIVIGFIDSNLYMVMAILGGMLYLYFMYYRNSIEIRTRQHILEMLINDTPKTDL